MLFSRSVGRKFKPWQAVNLKTKQKTKQNFRVRDLFSCFPQICQVTTFLFVNAGAFREFFKNAIFNANPPRNLRLKPGTCLEILFSKSSYSARMTRLLCSQKCHMSSYPTLYCPCVLKYTYSREGGPIGRGEDEGVRACYSSVCMATPEEG